MLLFIVGLPASGKSHVGMALAEALAYPFFDLDEEIEKGEGLSVSDIFIRLGEARFRELESEYLLELISLNKGVIATGGGTPCFFDQMNLMNSNGKTIFLDEFSSTILNRITKQGIENRPLFAGKNPEEVILELNAKRRSVYQQADILVDGIKTPDLSLKLRQIISMI